ncbi:hypothetical protein ElyMa_003127300 [Elysia marginata]|uniref:Uncharacterized protein n=1 Tax=Elysia marginata TaxID=1093978 RepID=A0AAV4IRJ3_9GAST|nr:hypothetical protein ElyMa_003127300 [Elysia marginata]
MRCEIVEPESSKCQVISTRLGSCQVTRRKIAAKRCDWILKDVQFSKCIESVSATEQLDLFKICVNAWCNNRHCNEAIQRIRQSGCHQINGVPEMASFLAGAKCPSVGLSAGLV